VSSPFDTKEADMPLTQEDFQKIRVLVAAISNLQLNPEEINSMTDVDFVLRRIRLEGLYHTAKNLPEHLLPHWEALMRHIYANFPHYCGVLALTGSQVTDLNKLVNRANTR
jgi:hypothetical protein